MKYEMSMTILVANMEIEIREINPVNWEREGGIGKLEAYLVEGTNGGDKNDCVGIIKIRHPCVSLATSTTHVEEMPSNGLAMDIYIKYMLCDAHCLDSSV
jgi:hypothetical protein